MDNDILSRYLDPQMIKGILERQACLAECCIREQEVAILFADIRGFTALSEHLEAKELVGFLNRFYGVMTEVVRRYQGSIFKFLGDGILSVFADRSSPPRDAEWAVQAAREMQRRFTLRLSLG